MPKNNPRRWMIASIIITIISIFMVFFGFILNEFNFFWMILVGLLLGITFGIMIFVFYKQARLLDNLFKDVDQLAHWTFDQGEQQQKVETEFKERKSYNKILIGIMTFFFVVIGGAFLIFGFDDAAEALFFGMIMGSVLLLLFVVAFTAPIISYRRMKAAVPEVYVSPYSAWVMGEYSQWAAPMTRLTGVNLQHHPDGAVVIAVYFEIFQRTGPQEHVCRIPVPKGKEAEGNDVAQQIAAVNGVAFTTSEEATDITA
jgi:MFS family permease